MMPAPKKPKAAADETTPQMKQQPAAAHNRCRGDCRTTRVLAKIAAMNMKTIMQTMRNDLDAFLMPLNTTKCLNTAAVIGAFMLDKTYMSTVLNACNSSSVREKKPDSSTIVEKLREAVMRPIPAGAGSQLYYILLTDGDFESPIPSLSSISTSQYFPGHVFIIEKCAGPTPEYSLYQSYVNEYDLKGFAERNAGKLEVDAERVGAIFDGLAHILEADQWDLECVRHWWLLTYVDSSRFLGHWCKNNFYLCFHEAATSGCVQSMRDHVDEKLRGLRLRLLTSKKAAREPYGDSGPHRDEMPPMTVAEVEQGLLETKAQLDAEFGTRSRNGKNNNNSSAISSSSGKKRKN